MSNAPATPTPAQPELEITIAGRPGVGKSTLAMFIAMCLEKVGIESIEIKNEDTNPEALAETFQERLKALAARDPQITIDMASLARDRVKLVLPPGMG